MSYTYQANAYFGIHYPADLIDTVLASTDKTAFKGLNSDEAEHKIGKCMLFASTNSDREGAATEGFIFVDEMTYGGEDSDTTLCSVYLEPSEMIKREKMYADVVNALEDLYLIITSSLKKKKINTDGVYLGWKVHTCEWDDGSDSDSDASTTPESSPEPVKPVKKPRAKKALTDDSVNEIAVKKPRAKRVVGDDTTGIIDHVDKPVRKPRAKRVVTESSVNEIADEIAQLKIKK